jgi:hypothetical protein
MAGTPRRKPMKAIALPLVLTMAAGMAAANEPARTAYKTTTSTASEKAEKGTKAVGEVVSAEGDKLVLKTSSGEETFMASGAVANQLKAFHAGERVVVRTHNNEILSVKLSKHQTKNPA